MLTRRAALCGSLAFSLAGGGARAAPEGFALYVADQDGKRILVIDMERDEVADALTLPSGPAALALAPDGETVYASMPETGEIAALDLATGKLQAPIYVGGEPFGLAATADEILAGDWSGAALRRVRRADGERIGEIAVGRAPALLLLDASRRRLYVVERDDAAVGVVDLDAMKRVAGIGVGEGPFPIAASPDGAQVFVASVRGGTVSVLDAASLTRIGEIACGPTPYGLAAAPDGAALLVVSQQGGTLSRVPTGRLEKTRAIRVGRYPEGVVVAPHLPKAYVMNWFSGDVSVIDLQSFEEVRRFRTGGGPRAGLCAKART